MSLSEEVRHALGSWGPRPVFVEQAEHREPRSWSPQEVLSRIDAAKLLLQDAGLKPRAPVAIMLPNSTDFVAVFLAAVELGAVVAPFKMEFRRFELEPMFTDLEPDLVVLEHSHLEVAGPFLKERGVIVRADGELALRRRIPTPGSVAAVDEDISSINFTYRGHGYPLGAMIPGEQYLLGAEIFAQGIRGGICERVAVALPMANIFALVGCVFTSLFEQMTMYLVGTVHPRRLLETVNRCGIDFLVLVPEIAALLARFVPDELVETTLDTIGSGGSHLTEELYEELQRRFGTAVLHGYGLTEFTPATRNLRNYSRPGTMGPPAAEIELTLSHESFGASSTGEILIRTPAMARGYYRKLEETAEAFDADGWFHTGDLGYFDGKHLVFNRETKGTRKVNGLMVDLEEVRRFLITEVPMEDAEILFQDGKLFARPHGVDKNVLGDLPTLRRRLGGQIASYKIPQIITT